MTIEKLSELLPGLTSKELDMISSYSLNKYFFLHNISTEDIFIPKKECLYTIIKGEGVASGFLEDYLEFNIDFNQGESFGFIDLEDESVSFILKGMPSATLLEVPIKKVMERANIEFLINIYEVMTKTMIRNIFKLFKAYAAKVTFSNEQYLLDFLISKGGKFTYISSLELAYLFHIELRTLQRIIKKLVERKIIEKNGKTLKITDMDSAKKILEIH